MPIGTPRSSPWYIDGLGGPRVERLRANTAAALAAADQYVWVYGERFRWWPTPNRSVRPESWSEAIPGCEQALRYARDPLDFARTEIAEMKQAGKLVNLARNGDFSSSTAKSMDGSEAEMARRPARPPVGARGRRTTRREPSPGTGRPGLPGKGAARASRVADGCFLQSYKVVPGERYAVRAACKVHGAGNAWLRVRWQTADGRWTAETQDQLFYCEASPENWQELFGVVEVPEGAGRLLILLGVGGQSAADDVVWFDDVELYRM